MFEVKLLMSSSSKTPKEDRDVKCDEEHSATPIDALEERVKNTSKIAEILQLGTAIAITSDFAIIFEIKIQRYIGERKPPEKLSEQGNFHVKCIGISAISVDLEVGQEEAISISTIEKSETMIVNNQRGLNFIDIDSSVPFFLKSSYHRVITICKKILEYDDEIEKTINDCIHEERNRKKVTKFEDFSTLRDLNSSKENIQGLHGRKNRNTSWCGVRSLLISGHEGAGKSYLLNRIERALQSTGDIKNKSSYRNVLILKLSGKKCGYKTISPSTSASTSSFPSFNFSSSSPLSASEYHNKNGDYINEKQSQNDERNYKKKKETRFHLQNFIQLLKSENQRHENFFTNYRIEKKLNVILLIDDLDSLLLPFVKNENDDIGSYGNDDGDKASVCTTAAFHLRQLLILLAIPDNNDGDDHDQIAIIGATSLSPVALPRANVGTSIFYVFVQ